MRKTSWRRMMSTKATRLRIMGVMAGPRSRPRPRSCSELSETQLRVRALETVLTEKGYVDPAALDRHRSRPTKPRSARAMARAWSPRPGAIRRSSRRCWRTPRKAVATLGHVAASATTSSRSRTRRSATTWSCARCAPAIRGRCSACRRSGTSRRLIARARSRTRAACSHDFGVDAAEGHRNPRVGFDRRDPLPRAADAARRHRRLERGQARRPCHARLA